MFEHCRFIRQLQKKYTDKPPKKVYHFRLLNLHSSLRFEAYKPILQQVKESTVFWTLKDVAFLLLIFVFFFETTTVSNKWLFFSAVSPLIHDASKLQNIDRVVFLTKTIKKLTKHWPTRIFMAKAAEVNLAAWPLEKLQVRCSSLQRVLKHLQIKKDGEG